MSAATVHPEAALLDPERHAAALADAERRLGRALTAGERRIDLVRLDRDLAAGKARLVAAIETERRSAARRFAREAVAGRSPRMRLRLSPAIRGALRGLYDAGVQAGRGELRRAGLDPDALPRALAAVPARLAVIEARIGGRLHDLGVADEHRLAVAFDLSAATQTAIVDAVRGLPGVRAIAADFTSVPAFAGLGSVWDQADAAGVTTAWTYTAVMDDGTCETCAGYDGETYDSWEAIQDVLPDGGPNPDCDGGDRCRCRAVPEFGDQTGGAAGPGPSDGGPGPSFAPAPDWLGEQATSDLGALRGEGDAVGYLTREQQATKAAQEGNVAGFHPHYLPREGYEAGDWATPAIREQHERLLRIGDSIDREVQARIETATSDANREIERLTRALDENRPNVIALDERRGQVIDDVYNELVAKFRADAEMTDERWNELTNLLNADPRVEAADRALDAAREGQYALNREREVHYATVASAQKDVLLSTLSEIRSFGATDAVRWNLPSASPAVRDLLAEAARFYPTDWIAATERLSVQLSDERAWCQTQRVEGAITHVIQTHADDVGTAIHELGHAQEARAAILDAERAFYDYRTTVGADGRTGAWQGTHQRLEKMGGTYRDDEVTRPDEFFSRYCGKDYGGRDYELLTMGLQRLWTRGELDAEYRAWLLGLLAAL